MLPEGTPLMLWTDAEVWYLAWTKTHNGDPTKPKRWQARHACQLIAEDLRLWQLKARQAAPDNRTGITTTPATSPVRGNSLDQNPSSDWGQGPGLSPSPDARAPNHGSALSHVIGRMPVAYRVMNELNTTCIKQLTARALCWLSCALCLPTGAGASSGGEGRLLCATTCAVGSR